MALMARILSIDRLSAIRAAKMAENMTFSIPKSRDLATAIPGFRDWKSGPGSRDPGIRDPGIAIPTSDAVRNFSLNRLSLLIFYEPPFYGAHFKILSVVVLFTCVVYLL